MLRSMTGFGHDEQTREGVTVTVEIRTVNHRYCDIYLRMPKQLNCYEDRVRTAISSRITRGKIDVSVTLDAYTAQSHEVVLDEALAGSYLAALRRLSVLFGIQDDVTAAVLSRFPDILKIERKEEGDLLGDLLEETVIGSVSILADMRTREGERLGETLIENLDGIGSFVNAIAVRAPSVVRDFKDRLDNRIAEWVDTQKLDPARLATEVALFADRCSIDEEIVRLRSHSGQMRDMLKSGSPIGKKLDFLIQEMNREVNTIGSKSNNLDITRAVVELKSEIEKMREQIQNIE
jgi:uncharacterized protein (TIGR00255 family)